MKIDALHNKDKVFKESLDLFIDRSLDFFDLPEYTPVESLSTEITETSTKKAFTDFVFKLKSGKGCNLEWEDSITYDDLLRFASYNLDLSRKHKLEFVTVIVTNKYLCWFCSQRVM